MPSGSRYPSWRSVCRMRNTVGLGKPLSAWMPCNPKPCLSLIKRNNCSARAIERMDRLDFATDVMTCSHDASASIRSSSRIAADTPQSSLCHVPPEYIDIVSHGETQFDHHASVATGT